MKRIYSHIVHTCMAIMLLAGCKSDYPHIEYDGDPGKVEFDNIDFRVPIQVAISDPLFDSYTRGMGAFDNVKDPNSIDKNWKDADIYVYAFYTPDGLKSSPDGINYSERMVSDNDEKFYCLVDDANNANIGHGKKARLNRDLGSFLQWSKDDQQNDDNMVYYNSTYPQYRYRFFAYHLDDAADLSQKPERLSDYVAYDIKIDGTQDLMCGYAIPTAKQIASLNAVSNKHVFNNLKYLAYSTETGYIDLFPVFDMKHQFVYLKFFLKADSIFVDGEKVLDPEIENVRIENVYITSPYHGEFVVAADDTSRLGVTFTSETKNLYMPVKVKTDADGNIVTDADGHRITASRDEEGKLMAGNEYGFNPRLKPVGNEQEVGMGYLLPVMDEYEVLLVYTQLVKDEQGNPTTIRYTSRHELTLDQGFKAGCKYEILVKVYGLRNIVLQLGNVQWLSGGDIDIDDDADR